MKVVAVFDVDGTLLNGDSLMMAARRARGPLGILIGSLECIPWLIAWQLRRISTRHFKERALAAFRICEAANRAEADGHTDWLLPTLQGQLRPEAMRRLLAHQQSGDRVLLCSASPRMLLQPLADALGVELLCTELHRVDGRWQPRLDGANCKGGEKVRRLETHLGPLEGLRIEAYGDSRGDRELLQVACIPHYRSFSAAPSPYPAFSLGPLLPVLAVALLGYGILGVWSQGDQLLPLLVRLWPRIALGLMLVLLGYAIRWGRWRLLLHAVDQHPPLRPDARIWMGSYAFTATPGKSGEAVRSLLLHQECGVPAPPTLMALVVERLTDGMAVLLLLLGNLPLLMTWRLPIAAPLVGGVIAVIALWLLCRGGRAGILIRSVAKRILPDKFARASGEGLACLGLLLRPGLLLIASVIGAVAWSLEGLSLWLLLRGIGVEDISWGGATIAHTAAGLLGALSMLPGGIGSTEAGTVGLLTLQGVSLAAATPATLLIRLMTLWFATGLGVLCLLWPRQGR